MTRRISSPTDRRRGRLLHVNAAFTRCHDSLDLRINDRICACSGDPVCRHDH
jgi:hypothetical protein